MQKFLLAFALLAALTSTASALTLKASIALNVRAHPGINHTIVDTLTPGERVRITHCSGNWCHIRHRGPDGWVAARYLTRLSSHRRRFFDDPCDVDATTDFHLRFGLYHSPLAKFCREWDD